MNLYLQVALPLAVTFVVLLVIMLLRRYRRADAFVLCAAVLALTLLTGIPGLQARAEARRADRELVEETGADPDQSYDQLENDLILAQQYLLDGNLTDAKSLLSALKTANAADPRVALGDARLAALEGRWTDARLLYEKAAELFGKDDDFPAAELSAVKQYAGGGDAAMAAFLSARGIDAAQYGLSGDEPGAVDAEALSSDICDALEESLDAALTDADELEETGPVTAAVNASKLTAAFSQYLREGDCDEAQVRKYVGRLSKAMEADPALASNAALRVARLKAYVLLEDYAEIAACVDRGAGLEELMIVSELYLAGYVDERDFSALYTGGSEEHLEEVLDQCRSVMDGELADATSSVRRNYKEKLKSLESLGESSALGSLRRDLRSRVQESTGNLTSKAYLELAKIEQDLGNESVAEQYITEAFGTVSLSDDEQYTVPMNSLLGIIGGNSAGGTEDIKKVAEYVSEAVDNSLPLDLTANALATGAAAPAGEEESTGFVDYMANTVSQKTAVLNIGTIDKDNFPEIRARIQVNSAQIAALDDMQQYLKVYDCTSEISNFTVEKLEFQTSRIILLCDVSGSMSGNVQSLKNAIIRFSDEMNAGEEISVVCFDDSVTFESRFSDDPDTVAGYADQIGAYNGTDMFSALKYAGTLFPDDINANNIVILLTDGEDNNPKGEATIRNEIGALCAANSATVYTLGLGSSVDTNYLTLLADAGNGSFLYVDSDESLDNFYDFIHQQLTNQYILTYTARNTTLNTRKLELSVEGELGSAEKTYYLVDPEYSDQSSDAYTPYVVEDTDIKLYGLATKFLYRSSRDQSVSLKGEGFDAGEDITVKLSGNVDYLITATFEDANTYSLLIPANVATGVYDLEVSIRGESFTLKDELTLAAQGSEKTYRYGAYEFTALSSYTEAGGAVVLSGNVVMNGWLRFKGDVTISGDQAQSGFVTVRDDSGCYVSYAENNSSGLANYLAKKGVAANFPALGSFELYVDDYTPRDYADFPVDKIDLLGGPNFLCFFVEDFGLRIYPDTLALVGLNVEYSLPFQKNLLKNLPKLSGYLNRSGGIDTELMLNATEVAFVGEFSYSNLEKTDFESIDFVGIPIRLKKLTVKVDTLRNDYSLEGELSFKSLKDMDSLDFEFAVKDGRFDTIALGLDGDYSVPIIVTPVPVSVSHFGFRLEGFSKYESTNSTLSNLLGTTVAFTFDTDVGEAPKVMQKLAKFLDVDKVVLASLEKCTVSANLKQFAFKFTADLKLFGIIDFGSCEIEAGSISYKNELINLGTDTVYGLRAQLTLGSKWESKNCNLELSGSAEVVAGWPYLGVRVHGDLGYDVGWWIFRADWDVEGDALIAIYQNQLNEGQFSIVLRGRNSKGEWSGFELHVSPSTKLDIHKY